MKRYQIVSITALLGGILLAATDASAIDTYRASGATCYKIGTAGTLSFFGGTIDNLSSTDTLTVMCPLLRDQASMNSGSVEMFDRHTTLDVACTIFAEGATGSTVASDSASVHSDGFASDFQTRNWGAIPTFSDDYHYATCTLPPTQSGNVSHLVRFTVNEN